MTYHQVVIQIAEFTRSLEWVFLGSGALWALAILSYLARQAWEHSPYYRHREQRRRAEQLARYNEIADRYIRRR